MLSKRLAGCFRAAGRPPSTAGGTPAATTAFRACSRVRPRCQVFPMIESEMASNPSVAGLHFRGKLPHLMKEGAVYFVTFRLADSLPAHEVARLKHERQVVLEQARAAKSPLTWHEEEQLLAWYCDKVEALLDAGHGACWLSKLEIASLVTDALKHFNGQRYELRAWVVMPNHVHAVVWPLPGQTLSDILHSWKSFTSKAANKLLGRTGEFWQKESFDHWIRDDAEHARLAAYSI